MTFWNVFFGVFAGILAGIGINIGLGYINGCITRKNIKKNLRFEIEFNIGKIDSFLEEFGKYKDAVLSESLGSYFGYINLSRVITTTLYHIFNSGLIYKLLDEKGIGNLQNFASEFSLGSEQYLNNQIKWTQTNSQAPNIKQIAMANIKFWVGKMNDNKTNLEEVLTKI